MRIAEGHLLHALKLGVVVVEHPLPPILLPPPSSLILFPIRFPTSFHIFCVPRLLLPFLPPILPPFLPPFLPPCICVGPALAYFAAEVDSPVGSQVPARMRTSKM